MASGRKRLRPLSDSSLQDDEDDDDCSQQSNKLIRLRKRSRAPIRATTNTSGSNSLSFFRNVSANSSNNAHTTNSASGGVDRRSSGSGTSGGRPLQKKSIKLGKPVEEPKGTLKPKEFLLAGRNKEVYGNEPRSNHTKTKSRPMKLYKKPLTSTPIGTPDSRKYGKGPTTTAGIQTPEFMKVKEDESLLEEKKERKRRRNKIMNRKTTKGQPVMRGRIELMLEEIKASTQTEKR